MVGLENAISTVVASVPGCLAAGVVDIHTGMLLDITTPDGQAREVSDLVLARTNNLLESDDLLGSGGRSHAGRAASRAPDRSGRDIVVHGDELLHIFQRGAHDDGVAVMAVCRITGPLEPALVRARGAMAGVSSQL